MSGCKDCGGNCNECHKIVITKQGERGPIGPQGLPGKNGERGLTGPQGLQGDPALIVSESVYNIEETSVADDFVDFTTGLIEIPQIENSETLKITAVFTNTSAPVSNGFGVYFFFNNYDYVHPSSSTPTYGNSFFQLPFDVDQLKVEIEINRIDSSSCFLLCKQTLRNSSDSLPVEGKVAWYSETLDWASVTDLIVQSYVTASGVITLDYLSLNKI